MSSRKPADEARIALAKARAEQARRVHSVPSLHLLVYPHMNGMRLSLAIHHNEAGGRRRAEVLRTAEWTPAEVTPARLADWGRRALADWLAEPTLEFTTRGPWPTQ